MPELTVKTVLDAYDKIKMKPCKGTFYNMCSGVCCPIMAVYLADHDIAEDASYAEVVTAAMTNFTDTYDLNGSSFWNNFDDPYTKEPLIVSLRAALCAKYGKIYSRR